MRERSSSFGTICHVAALLLDLDQVVLSQSFLPDAPQGERHGGALPFKIHTLRTAANVNDPVEHHLFAELRETHHRLEELVIGLLAEHIDTRDTTDRVPHFLDQTPNSYFVMEWHMPLIIRRGSQSTGEWALQMQILDDHPDGLIHIREPWAGSFLLLHMICDSTFTNLLLHFVQELAGHTAEACERLAAYTLAQETMRTLLAISCQDQG